MGVDLRGLVQQMQQDVAFNRLVNDPMASFAVEPDKQPLMGATLLPDRKVPENTYTEQGLRYRTVIANDSTRYSPVQKKGGMLVGSMLVQLSNSDIGAEITAQDYDAIIKLIEQSMGRQGMEGGDVSRPAMSEMQALMRFVEFQLTRPLVYKNELMRWQAIVGASVVRTGDNGYKETLTYPNPTGHRVSAGGTWSNNSYDPYPDIVARVEFLRQKGYNVDRIISSTFATSKLVNNTNIKGRLGLVSINGAGSGIVAGLPGRASLQQINGILEQDGIPPIERYDKTFRTQTGYYPYLQKDAMVFICTTGRDEMIDLGDAEVLPIQNTLGYCAIGRAAGQNAPGPKIHVEAFDNKPPRIEGEGWQTSLPVILEPEAISVITGIA